MAKKEERNEVHLHHDEKSDTWGVAMVGPKPFDAWKALDSPQRFRLTLGQALKLMSDIGDKMQELQ